MTLKEFLKSNNLNYSKFGKIAGLSRDSVRKYVLNIIKPASKSLIKIQQATNNEVQPIDFYNGDLKHPQEDN